VEDLVVEGDQEDDMDYLFCCQSQEEHQRRVKPQTIPAQDKKVTDLISVLRVRTKDT
jgi:hypothetical protein